MKKNKTQDKIEDHHNMQDAPNDDTQKIESLDESKPLETIEEKIQLEDMIELNEVQSDSRNLKKMGLGVLVLFLAILLMVSFIYQSGLKAVQSDSEIYSLNVAEGMYFTEILDKLEKDNVIKSTFSAKLYARFNQLQDVAAGVYELDKSWDAKEMIRYLNETMPHDDILIKFPESAWAKEIADILAANFPYEASEFIDLWNDENTIHDLMNEYFFLTEDIFENKEEKRVLLEGFLYPDTYSFNTHSTIQEITHVILDNTLNKLNSIQDILSETEFNMYELMTLSSIVMYEAGLPYDQQMVAGVFMNRLDIDMALQSSVTVCYALYEFDDWEECESGSSIRLDNPYNTYVYAGLPIGPILNPNLEAIVNTIQYLEHDYYYFVADAYEGGDGKVYYSKTLQEHEQKISELLNR